MIIPSLRRQRQRGLVAMVWAIIILFLIFIVVIGGIVFTLVRTVKKLVPPPPPDEDGVITMPGLGTKYGGGTVVGYAPPPHYSDNLVVIPPYPPYNATNVAVYASDVPTPGEWTNLVYLAPLDSNPDLSVTNLLTLEGLTNSPPQRFYNIKFIEFNR